MEEEVLRSYMYGGLQVQTHYNTQIYLNSESTEYPICYITGLKSVMHSGDSAACKGQVFPSSTLYVLADLT